MKRCIFLAGLIAAGLSAVAQSDVSTAKWLQQPAMIDGKLTEWNQPLNFYDSETQLFFAIANDSSHLYLCFESKNEMSQAKLMRAGMKITLSTKGKTKHEVTIAYPLPPDKNVAPMSKNIPNAGAEEAIRDKQSFHQHFLQTHAMMEAEGFTTAKGVLPLVNPTGVVAALNWDTTSNLIYELAIPKKEFFGNDYSNTEALATTLTLDVVVNAMPKETGAGNNRKNSSGGGNSQNGDLPGDRRGQFNGGGYGTGNEGMRPDMTAGENISMRSKSSFKQKFVLGKAG